MVTLGEQFRWQKPVDTVEECFWTGRSLHCSNLSNPAVWEHKNLLPNDWCGSPKGTCDNCAVDLVTKVLIIEGNSKQFLEPVDIELEQTTKEKGPHVYFDC